jgi:general secretion pathway protein B
LPNTLANAAANGPAANSTETTLPSATALAAQGILLPELRLELHAYADRPGDRFVFINGRKYAEGQRLNEGPEIVAIAPNGAVLSHLGHRFLLSPE